VEESETVLQGVFRKEVYKLWYRLIRTRGVIIKTRGEKYPQLGGRKAWAREVKRLSGVWASEEQFGKTGKGGGAKTHRQ